LVALRPLIIPEAPETKDKAPEIKGKAPETKGKAPKVKGKVPPQLVPPQVRMRKWTDSPEVYSKATSSKEGMCHTFSTTCIANITKKSPLKVTLSKMSSSCLRGSTAY
jgi:hypothetical protein